MQIRRENKAVRISRTPRSEKLARSVAECSSLYREAAAEREEIMRHKWFLSERAGYDVGYARALYDWIAHHRVGWRKFWRQKNREFSEC